MSGRNVELPIDTLTPEQQSIHDVFKGLIGHPARGPFAIWMEIPHIGKPAVDLFAGLRTRAIVERRLEELMVLIVARHLSAEFAWVTHEAIGLKAGLSRETIEAVRHRRKPTPMKADEELVYDITTAMCTAHKLDDDLYRRAVETMGRPWLLELVAGIGFFHMIGMTLNAFEVPTDGGANPFD